MQSLCYLSPSLFIEALLTYCHVSSPSYKLVAVTMMLFIEPANMPIYFVHHSMQQTHEIPEQQLALKCATRQQCTRRHHSFPTSLAAYKPPPTLFTLSKTRG